MYESRIDVRVGLSGAVGALLLMLAFALYTPSVAAHGCEPEFITEEREVEVGTEYEWQLQQWAIFKWVDNGQPVWSVEEPDTPGHSIFKRYVLTGGSRPVYETQQVEVPNPEYDPLCGQETPTPEPTETPEPTVEPVTYVTVAWLLPIDFTTWDGLGQPTGFGADGAIWPQTFATSAETGESVNLDALDEMQMGKCSVYQIDTYPVADGIHTLSVLDWGDDHGSVISWKFLFNDDCEPDPTPTPEPTEEPTPSTERPYDIEKPSPETPSESPTPVYDVTICFGGAEYQVTAEQAVSAFGVGAAPGTCAPDRVRASSTAEVPTVEYPMPAHAGHGWLAMQEQGTPYQFLIGVGLVVFILTGTAVLAFQKKD